jgi:hypothetical protein
MAKMSSKMAKYSSGTGLFTNFVTIIIYVVAAYILYKIVMYFINMRSSAMPNLPTYSSNSGKNGNKQKGGCSTGTCGGN